ncbi:MAG: sigma-70 family RNA polymerase sigma factor [Vicinamibacterales bacterium]
MGRPAAGCGSERRVPTDITELLADLGLGNRDALNRLIPLVYQDLRRVARGQLRRRRPGESLDTTGLVHEAYVRLTDHARQAWTGREHFFAVSAMAMRQIVVDHARRRTRQKRGGDQVMVPFEDAADPAAKDADRVLEVDRALERLAAIDPRLAQVVECRFFAGLSEDETATALNVSVRTAQREWFKARAWLRSALGNEAQR